ncbi:M48 family metallopeptidase [Cellvibrio sp. OA-2007]|uniref:M48 family metallopeptidase n=1 Tax=Cellvibrio sp. OA-2007 TaxID=529823 RepID=UPI000780AD15|nr:M48 family metallopeptidase [Cellvibrio sp. OA-2007]
MNFFEHQDRARRKTHHLILLLILAAFTLIAITTLLFAAFVYFGQEQNSVNASTTTPSIWQGIIHALSFETFLWIALSVSSVVFIGSLFRFFQLRAGGQAIAEALGGHLLSGNTQDADERKILNVVEEMAIASGTSVPPVFLIEDDAINAFAAGYHPQDAVIGITRGCIHALSRDELQGVIAHEFSHIYHGDMRINMRLIALLHGILVIGLIGEFLMRSASNRSIRRSSKDNSPAALLALGLGLLVIGYSGIFFGNLIKAAVSRQREFLADASAVQFTRNPDGIAGALKKIGGSSSGSQLQNEHAAEFSHMYFGQGVKSFFNLMATHPPLEDRIKRIIPNWDGEFTQMSNIRSKTSFGESGAMGFSAGESTADEAPINAAIDVDATLNQIAQPSQPQIEYARERIAEIPPYLKAATQEPFSARGIIFGLLLDRHRELRQQQLALLSEHLSPADVNGLTHIVTSTADVDASLRLPLIELCLSALKQLSADQQNTFMNCVHLLIRADNKVSLMEWAIYRIVLHNTRPHTQQIRKHNLRDLQNECQLLLSLLAYAGAASETEANAAFSQAAAILNFPELELLPRNQIKLPLADTALEQLNLIKPLQKPQILKAMSQCILHDGKVSTIEAEVFRAIADSLDCPIPPLIPRMNQ